MRSWLFFFLMALPAMAATHTHVVTVTNVPLGGPDTNIVVKGVRRDWTNATAATTIQTNALGTVNGNATNLFNAFGSFPQAGVTVTMTNTNVVVFLGTDLALSVTGSWASVTTVTQANTNLHAFMVPQASLGSATERTNDSSLVAKALSDYSTNAIATNAIVMTNFLSRGEPYHGGTTQRVFSAVQLDQLAFGTNTGKMIGGVYETVGLTNVQYLYGFLGILSNGTMYFVTNVGGTFTNGSFSGTVVTLTNGIWTNAVLQNPKLTNGVNYGNAFSSPGTNSGSQQFAGGTAPGLNALSLGGTSSGDYSTTVGSGSAASGYASFAGALDAIASGYASTAVGTGSGATGSNTFAGGFGAAATHANAFAIGANSATSQDGEGMLGSVLVHIIRTFGRLQAGSITNAVMTGTNRVDGDWAWMPVSVSSLANGNNIAVPGTNYLLLLSGPTAAHAICGITGGRNGREIVGQNRSTGLLTIANESGVDPTAANRILTPTRADVTVQTNGFFKLMWLDTSSRWELQWKYP
jgi:hypothetical protein